MTENEEFIFDHFLISLKSGLQSVEDIITDTLEAVEDEGWESEISEEWIRATIQREYNKNLKASENWTHPTDPERLLEAFDNLCREKVMALHNAGYESSDAVYDAGKLWTEAEDVGVTPVGYCYYHGQDIESVFDDQVLQIGFYGSRDKNDKETIIVGHKVAAALRKVGFDIDWNGSASKRIAIKDFNWQNTFTTDEDVEEKWGYDRVLTLMQE